MLTSSPVSVTSYCNTMLHVNARRIGPGNMVKRECRHISGNRWVHSSAQQLPFGGFCRSTYCTVLSRTQSCPHRTSALLWSTAGEALEARAGSGRVGVSQCAKSRRLHNAFDFGVHSSRSGLLIFWCFGGRQSQVLPQRMQDVSSPLESTPTASSSALSSASAHFVLGTI